MSRRLIIVNRMYAGDFFNEKNNIGGEVINLLRTDDKGENYIWLNPHGKCDSKVFDGYDEVYVLLVRRHAPWKWKVLGKAKVDIGKTCEFMSNQINKDAHNHQKDYIDHNGVIYGGKKYYEIPTDNTLKNRLLADTALFLTFKSEKIWIPDVETNSEFKNTIFNVNKVASESNDEVENSKNQYKKGLTPRPLNMFLHDKEGIPESKRADETELINTYNFINDIIGEEDNDESSFVDGKITKTIKWKELPQDATAKNIISNNEVFEDYFLKVIREEDRELVFSNMLAYFLRDNEILKIFVENVLKITNFDYENVSITREEANIDILISSNSHKIIIENKIKSNLIQKRGGMKTKLEDYFKGVNDNVLGYDKKELEEKFENQHLQTDRYYAYVLSEAIKENIKTKDNIKGFILVPNYNFSLIEDELQNNALFKEEFVIITYNDIFEAFSKSNICKKAKYMDEFLYAITKHKKDVDNSIEDETNYNFCKKIKEA